MINIPEDQKMSSIIGAYIECIVIEDTSRSRESTDQGGSREEMKKEKNKMNERDGD